jgi:[ribosomal protein S5]-alanine N-acetyltransferase
MNKKTAAKFIQEHKNKIFGTPGEWVQYAIELSTNRALIGDCAIRLKESDHSIAEIGITISRAEQQKGYAHEAMTGLLHFLFESNNIRHIVERVDIKNIASIALLESLSFRKNGHFIDNIFLKGEWCSEFQYEMLKSEWLRLRGKV